MASTMRAVGKLFALIALFIPTEYSAYTFSEVKGGAGHADALFINSSTPVPTPKEGDALIKVKAFGLNRSE
jgi:hypothetical protein